MIGDQKNAPNVDPYFDLSISQSGVCRDDVFTTVRNIGGKCPSTASNTGFGLTMLQSMFLTVVNSQIDWAKSICDFIKHRKLKKN